MIYSPTDVDAAYDDWGANCGPATLAAILGCEVEAVRRFMDSGWERRRYTNLMHMHAALRNAGVQHRSTADKLPRRGLAFIQFCGPWTEPGKPIASAYRHTHWIGIDGTMVYDVNAGDSWVEFELWKKDMPILIREGVPHATGEWFVRRGFEIDASEHVVRIPC
jgi:hypothetical protein